jgi:hypothetical protein
MPWFLTIPRPSRMTLGDVVVLAAAGLEDPAAELQRIYDWYFDRATAAARAAFATAGAILLAFLGAYTDDKLGTGEAVALAATTIPFFLIGGIRSLALNSLHREYVRAQAILVRLKPYQPVLASYWSWV